jgi:hypothetical protein
VRALAASGHAAAKQLDPPATKIMDNAPFRLFAKLM